MRIVKQSDLPAGAIARELVGDEHELGVSLILIDAEPGRGPRLHRHPYETVFVVLEGKGTFTVGDEEREVAAGEIAIIPAGSPHQFVSADGGRLRQIDVHVSPPLRHRGLEPCPCRARSGGRRAGRAGGG